MCSELRSRVLSLFSLFTLFNLLVFGILLLIWLAIYRLYLHPLAKFPGPKLAALSRWYEFYYNVIRGGLFWREIEKMHEQYGMWKV